jgi:tagatose 1,6-diphosphate aldolase
MTRSFSYIDPGPLVDADLELIAPSAAWLDAVMAAQSDPATQEQMPAVAAITRDQQQKFLDSLAAPAFHAGDPDAHLVPSYHFWMLRRRHANGHAIVGGIGLRLGENSNLQWVIGHIGYQVYPFARGNHYAARACRLLLPLAERHGMRTLWITCNPDNAASKRTCERIGATLIDVVPVPPNHPLYERGEREKCRYRLDLFTE